MIWSDLNLPQVFVLTLCLTLDWINMRSSPTQQFGDSIQVQNAFLVTIICWLPIHLFHARLFGRFLTSRKEYWHYLTKIMHQQDLIWTLRKRHEGCAFTKLWYSCLFKCSAAVKRKGDRTQVRHLHVNLDGAEKATIKMRKHGEAKTA